MIKRNEILKALEQVLTEECSIHEQYLLCLDEERKAMVALDLTLMSSISEQRDALGSRLAQLAHSREFFVKELPQSGKKKLSEIIASECEPSDRAKLLPLCDKLRELMKLLFVRVKEYNQINEFCLKIVNGTLSIICSTSQGVVRGYNPQGKMQEIYHRTGIGGVRREV